MTDFVAENRALWAELTEIHQRPSRYYDVEAFKAGELSLRSIERAEVGDVRGRTLLHLQCHFGLDTLSWARLGARVTGVDVEWSHGLGDIITALAGAGLRIEFLHEFPVCEGEYLSNMCRDGDGFDQGDALSCEPPATRSMWILFMLRALPGPVRVGHTVGVHWCAANLRSA